MVGASVRIEEYKKRKLCTKINDKLENLEASNPFFPPNTDTASALKIVPVHKNVHHEVEGDWNP